MLTPVLEDGALRCNSCSSVSGYVVETQHVSARKVPSVSQVGPYLCGHTSHSGQDVLLQSLKE